MKTKIIIIISLIVFLFSCNEDTPNVELPKSHYLFGKVQKGPFRTGSGIIVSELDSLLKPTGISYSSSTTDNLGNYELSDIKLISDYVEVNADGFYYNENTGLVSTERIRLKAIANIADSSLVNINVFTTLSYERIKYLVQKEQKSFKTAKTQAQQEILEIFDLENVEQLSSEFLNIEQTGKMNSLLLAISSIVQGEQNVAQLSELMASFALDIKEDGKLDTKGIQQLLITNAQECKIDFIHKNLSVVYPSIQFTGFDQSIAEFINETTFEPLITTSTYAIQGFVQKGPYRSGSIITVTELDSLLKPTGLNYTSTVSDNFGKFEVPDVKLKSDYVELMAEGFYYHENFNIVTWEKLVLKAIVNIADSSSVNVNILTHLIANRIKYLVQTEGKSYKQAKQQAQNELLKVFHLEEEVSTNYEFIDFTKTGELNSKLFAIAMIVQGHKNVVPLTEFITAFAIDFKTDGQINDKNIQQHLITSAQWCNVGEIRKNIMKLYKMTTFNNFQQYVTTFIEKSSWEPFLTLKFNKETPQGINLLGLPDNTTLSTSQTYCLNQNIALNSMNQSLAITILEEKGSGNVTYTENDLTYWDYDKDYGSNESGTLVHGISIRAWTTNKYADTPLLLNFKETGRIKLTLHLEDQINLPDNGGYHVIVKYFNW